MQRNKEGSSQVKKRKKKEKKKKKRREGDEGMNNIRVSNTGQQL